MILDLLLLVFIFYFGYKGFQKGALVTLVASIATLIGVVSALSFSASLSSMLFNTTENSLLLKVLPLISYLIVFFITIFLVKILASSIRKLIRSVGLGFLDRILGLLISIISVGIISSLCLWLLNNLSILSREVVDGSILFKLLLSWAPKILDFFAMIFPFLKSILSKWIYT